MNKAKEMILSKRTLYAFCFLCLMVIDWTRGSQVGSTWAWTVNMTGVVMAVILFSAYDLKMFLKPIYIIYSAVCIVSLPFAYRWWNLHQAMIYRDKLLTAVLNVWLLGIIAIKLIEDVVIRKTKKLCINKLEIVVACMLLWMFLSVNEDVWPLWYLVMFGLFYYTDYSTRDMEELKQGLLNGIIAGFFILQGTAFVFRPFDSWHHRYCGIYANCNMNALFYCVVWIAFLVKMFYLKKSEEKRWKLLVCFLFSGAVMGFMILTISKTAWVSAFIVALFYVIFANFLLLRQKAGRVTISIFALSLVMCISVPIVYSAVRYIPPIFHHPVWYEGEYNEDKVHSFDPWDSEKYVSYDEFKEAVEVRVRPFLEVLFGKYQMGMTTVCAAEEAIDTAASASNKFEKDFSSTIGRVEMWEYYLKNGTIQGHLSPEGHDIGKSYYVWHAQNMFVQLWYYYGIPSAILFVIVGIWTAVCSIQKIVKGNDKALICLLYLVLFGVYGLFECVWYPGQIILFLAFFTPKFLMNSQRQ